MPLDFEALKEEHFGPLEAQLRAIAQAAYEQGYADGMDASEDLAAKIGELSTNVADSITHMLSATKDTRNKQAPLLAARRELERQIAGLRVADDRKAPRARRGLVGEQLRKALTEYPGLAASDYERIVTGWAPEVSAKSVGNELRRGEDEGRYVRDRTGGYRWYLKGQIPETEGAPGKESSVSEPNQGGSDGTAIE